MPWQPKDVRPGCQPSEFTATGIFFARTFASTCRVKLACEYTHKPGDLAPPGKEEATMGNKAWMLVWVGVSVSAVLCVYAAVWN